MRAIREKGSNRPGMRPGLRSLAHEAAPVSRWHGLAALVAMAAIGGRHWWRFALAQQSPPCLWVSELGLLRHGFHGRRPALCELLTPKPYAFDPGRRSSPIPAHRQTILGHGFRAVDRG
jgi:hypothetical protein